MVDEPQVNQDWARFLNGDELLLKFGQAMFPTG
jgi:hypothetical protein